MAVCRSADGLSVEADSLSMGADSLSMGADSLSMSLWGPAVCLRAFLSRGPGRLVCAVIGCAAALWSVTWSARPVGTDGGRRTRTELPPLSPPPPPSDRLVTASPCVINTARVCGVSATSRPVAPHCHGQSRSIRVGVGVPRRP